MIFFIFIIIFLLIYLLFYFIISYFIPVFIINKYYDLNLSKSSFIKYCLYFGLAPISIFFSKNFYLELAEKSQKLKNKFIFVVFYIIIVTIGSIISGIISISIRHYYMPFQISGESMSPNYYHREFIILKRNTLINRGDVVVFNTHIENKNYFIKRIIGIPGDSIKISDGKVYLKKSNETEYNLLNENYLNSNSINNTFVKDETGEKIYNIPDGKYFLMGDNRDFSMDSRSCFGDCETYSNFIDEKDILGKAFIDLGYYNFESGKLTNPRFFDIK